MVASLRGYAARYELLPRFGVAVRRLERDGEGWQAETGGEPVRAGQVVLACGCNREPFLPTWPGQQSFGGQLIHACAYRGRTGAAGGHRRRPTGRLPCRRHLRVRRIAALAETFDLLPAPHCPIGPFALAACPQVDFATPNVPDPVGVHGDR